MNLPEPFPERPTVVVEFKDFSFGEICDQIKKEESGKEEPKEVKRIIGSDLFSLFTADIMKQDVLFTR